MVREKSIIRGLAATLVFLVMVPINSAIAQDTATSAESPTPVPFSELELKISLGKNFGSDELYDSWTAAAAGSVDLATPFYAGYLTIGIQVEPYESQLDPLPSYWSAFGRVGWQIRWSGSRDILYDTGVRLGLFFMTFEGDASAGITNESELAFSVFHAIHIPVFTSARLVIEGAYSKVFTHRRINLYHLSLGLIVPVGMPRWLRSILE